MAYLTTVKVTPNNKEIELDLFGYHQPYEKQTLEHEGCPEWNFIETVEYNGDDVTDVITDALFSQLEDMINKPHEY